MKKIIFVIPFLLVSINLYSAIIVNSQGPYYVGQKIGFKSNCFDPGNTFSSCVWNFGDGTTISLGPKDLSTSGRRYHIFRSPGTYRVSYSRSGPSSPPKCLPLTEYKTITISENRSIRMLRRRAPVGREIRFAPVNFNTPTGIRWDMGDGTIYTRANRKTAGGRGIIAHTYKKPGYYTIRAYDWKGNLKTIPITLNIRLAAPVIDFIPKSPRVDETVGFLVSGIDSNSIAWNFGDGTIVRGSVRVNHTYRMAGTYTVSAGYIDSPPTVSTNITVLPENRYIAASPLVVKPNEEVTVTAYNFRGKTVWWNFGDGVQKPGFYLERHAYAEPGTYTITARDEGGKSEKKFTTNVTVRNITDRVNVEVLEIRLDNGKNYKIVPRNSKHIRAILKMKMRGTGIVSGRWVVDGSPFEFFNEVVYQGRLKEIYTRKVPGLPTIEPGLHTITLELTRPALTEDNMTFPVLKYFVLAGENIVEIISPQDGFVAKDKDPLEFSWKEARGVSRYQVAFSNYLNPLFENAPSINWLDVTARLKFKPGANIWNKIKRNRWTYWKVRALDIDNNVVAESGINDIKVVIAEAKVDINKVTNLNGEAVEMTRNNITSSEDDILVHGSLEYMGSAEFLVLRVYADEELVDLLLFRDVKKNEKREFETSIPNKKRQTKIVFQVLNTSSPAVIVGIHGMILKNSN